MVYKLARSRSPDSIKAEELFHSGMSLVDIAKRMNKPEGTVRRWKSTQGWDKSERSEKEEKKANVRKREREAVAEDVRQVIENPDLTDKQRLFCCIYVRCFNATRAYQKAYGVDYNTALSIGYRLLENVGVREEIKRLKQNRINREMMDETDIFQKYMDIAFADITDFVEFGRENIPVMTMYGPLEVKDEETGEKVQVTKEVNTVRFKEHTDVDGTIITEVKQGRDGASIKLADRMKALDWIAGHMDLATEEQKARINQIKANTERLKKDTSMEDDVGVEIINDAPKETGSDIRDCDTEISSDIQQ
ncbi:terminase small subunit [Faecalicatena contorta]|nr:terminase small subunit [Faecalicatena contorta]